MIRALQIFVVILVCCAGAFAQATDEGRASLAIRGTSRSEAVAKQTARPEIITVGEFYPNPASALADLDLNLAQPGKVVFYNLLGTRIATYDFEKGLKSLQVNLADFNEGVYFGVVSANNKTIATRRLLVRR